jgi:hypothetical protein
MKRICYLIILSGVILFTNNVFSQETKEPEKKQEETKQENPPEEDWKSDTYVEKPKYPYLKEKYEDTFKLPFNKVWEAAALSIENINCQIIAKNTKQDDEGLYKGKIESDFCVFAVGDTTWDNLKFYATDLPFIRGGTWVTGRFQYKIIIRENKDGSTYLRVIGEVSAFESYVTTKVHFFQSNGFKESMMMERVKKNLELPYDLKE